MEQFQEERRLMIFQMAWQAEQQATTQKYALSALALVDSVMLIGLALLIGNSQEWLNVASIGWQLLFSATAILSALLLILSLYLSLASQLTRRASLLAADLAIKKLLTVPREALVENALIRLEAHEQAIRRLRVSFRQALFLLTVALGLLLLLIVLLAA